MLALAHGYIKNEHETERKHEADMLRELQKTREAELRRTHNRGVFAELETLKVQTLQEIRALVDLKTWSLKDTLRTRVKKIKELLTDEGIPGYYNPDFDARMQKQNQDLAEEFSLLAAALEAQIDKAGDIDDVIPQAFSWIKKRYQDLCLANHPCVLIPELEPHIIEFKRVLRQQTDLYKYRFDKLKKDLQEGYDLWVRGCKSYHQTFKSTVDEMKSLDDQFLSCVQAFYPLVDALDQSVPPLHVHVAGCKAAIRLLFFIHAGVKPDLDILLNDRLSAMEALTDAKQRWCESGKWSRFTSAGRAILREKRSCERTVKRYEMIEASQMKDVTALVLIAHGLIVQRATCSWYQFVKKHELKLKHDWLSHLIVILDKHSAAGELYARLKEPTWAQAKHKFIHLFDDFLRIFSQHKTDETVKAFFKSAPVINLRYDINEVSELWDKISSTKLAFQSQLKIPQLYPRALHSARGYFSLWTHGDIGCTTKATPESLSSLRLGVL